MNKKNVCSIFLTRVYLFTSQTAKQVTMQRFLLVFGGGLFSVFGSAAVGFPGAGALGALSISFVAGQKWKKQKVFIMSL